LVETGETQIVASPSGAQAGKVFWDFESWYPDSTRFTARLAIPGRPVSLWSVPILGGSPQKLIEDLYGNSQISPDGSLIAFSKAPGYLGAREMWLMGARGESPHRILAADEHSFFGKIGWSPAGNRITYIRGYSQGDKDERFIESCDLNGTNKKPILSNSYPLDFAWVSRRLIYSRPASVNDENSMNLWELEGDPENETHEGKPRHLTDWPGFWIGDLSAAADGKRLAFLRGTSHASVFVGDLDRDARHLINPRLLTTDTYWNIPLAWTADSREVIFSSVRTTRARQMYRQVFDGS
jgi:Tol biopolymer transport system component